MDNASKRLAKPPRSSTVNGIPLRARRSKLPHTDPATDPHKREWQHRCHHDYVVEGLSYREISRRTGIAEHVVSNYVRMEAERRAVQREEQRAAEIDRSIAIYNDIAREYRLRMDRAGSRGDEGRYVLQARTRIDALLGLDAPIKVSEKSARAPLVNVSIENVTALLNAAIEARE
jgi:hypothetical protein